MGRRFHDLDSLAQVLGGLGWAFSGVNHASISQALTPHHLLGRVTAARRCLVFGMSALGAAIGGYLGTSYGLAETLVVAAALSILSPVLLFLSPVRHLHGLPDSTGHAT
jgi:predicted MFS family arabinose efflux permease